MAVETAPIVYPETPAAVLHAATLRQREFLAFFDAHGGRYALGNRAKPHLGPLSPGCQTCMEGTWSCVYLNGICTRNCFYCPQDRAITAEPPARTDDELQFASAADYVAYTRQFACAGIGISGGEPFLQFDRLSEHVRSIRQAYGPRPYVWAYTNGDLATDDCLARLRQDGLDELRINISANAYDLSAVARAARHIGTVTVEIPAIPEDVAIVKAMLPDLEAAGVKHLNIHQLLMNEYNHLQLKARGYTVTQARRYRHGRPVLGSELAAFDILEHALRTGIRMGINYCSRCYKARFQEQALRRRHAFLFGIPAASVTSAGYVRTVTAEASGQGADVAYAAPLLRPLAPDAADAPGTRVFAGNRVALEQEKVREYRLENPAAVVFFQKLFVEGKVEGRVVREAAELFGVAADGLPGLREDLAEFARLFEGLEHAATDLPDYD